MPFTNIPEVPNYTGSAPNRTTQQQAEFSANVDDSLLYQTTLSENINTTVTAINTVSSEITVVADEVQVNADAAEASAEVSASNANFNGKWVDQSGAVSIPFSVFHAGVNWQLLTNLADVTASEPSLVNNDWLDIVDRYTRDQVGIDISSLGDSVDNRNYIYSLNSKVYVGSGYIVRCDLLPSDDISIFFGDGKLLTNDPFGNAHFFDISKKVNGSTYTAKQVIAQAIKDTSYLGIGVVGDSVTDGSWGKRFDNPSLDWQPNPAYGQSPENNLVSTNYDHNATKGSGSWFSVMGRMIKEVSGFRSNNIEFYNAASTGKKLSDGWAYRNYDYGFFLNDAYLNQAPGVCMLSMGVNDFLFGYNTFEDYLFKFDQFIQKAWGYGSAVVLVSVETQDKEMRDFELAIKNELIKKYPRLEIH